MKSRLKERFKRLDAHEVKIIVQYVLYLVWLPTQQLCQHYNWLMTRWFSVQKLRCGQSWYGFEDSRREHRKFPCHKAFCKRLHNKLVNDRGKEFFLLFSPSLLQVPNHKHGSVLLSENTNWLDTKQKLSESHNDLEGLILLHHGSLKKESVFGHYIHPWMIIFANPKYTTCYFTQISKV